MTNLNQLSAKNTTVIAYDVNGVARNLSGDLNEVTLTWLEDNAESATFGQGSLQRVGGVRDADLEGMAIYSTRDPAGVDAVLTGILAASSLALVHYFPAGVAWPGVRYSGSMALLGWEIEAAQGAVTVAHWAFELASGSLTYARIPGGPGPFVVGSGIVGTHYIGGGL